MKTGLASVLNNRAGSLRRLQQENQIKRDSITEPKALTTRSEAVTEKK
jgi:hypothetical protein